ncbi:hypothetical protein [Pseudomonas fluorescens]|uniref:hypothetical protein n=1 Tax=Pseudomonas fluorescens TaxID=294 RepID=UPI001240DB86|nr:hypothetical protein [Pseudomonas fluorescens]VVM58468.1 hypothetical protein PS639_01152 [Pseudomonas fluorescens]
MPTAQLSIDKKTQQLLNNPAELVNYSQQAWNNMPRAEIDALQINGLKQRFEELRNRIPVLQKLADAQGVETIEQLDDVVPLLFEHTVYKSYPPSLLEKRSFSQINKWLGKLVTPEIAEAIAAVNVSDCQGLDEWFETMDEGVPQVRISHTSGTSGTLSFLPHGVREWEKAAQLRKINVWSMEGPDTPEPNLHSLYPYYRKGYLSHVRANDVLIPALLPNESHFHAAYPTTLSTDVLHLGAKLRAAQSKGTLDRLVISPELLAKKKAFDQLQADMPQHLETFFNQMTSELKGQRVYIGATWNLLHSMAKAGLERGLEGVFHPDSYVHTAGGGKGVVQPEGWREDVLRFTGAKVLNESYAMSEVFGAHTKCEAGHFHFAHTVIPYLLDSETSKPLPRTGRVTGRAAFFDLGAEFRWGGFITGDEITVEWDKPCSCGRPSAYVVGPIQRYSELNGGDDKITCAATEDSHRQAMDFLSTLEA